MHSDVQRQWVEAKLYQLQTKRPLPWRGSRHREPSFLEVNRLENSCFYEAVSWNLYTALSPQLAGGTLTHRFDTDSRHSQVNWPIALHSSPRVPTDAKPRSSNRVYSWMDHGSQESTLAADH